MTHHTSPHTVHVVGAAILHGGRCLIARRSADMPLPGKWEFPGGKVEAGERPEAALEREIAEELGARVRVGDGLGRGEAIQGARGRGEATQAARRIVLEVYAAAPMTGDRSTAAPDFHPREHSELRWVTADELAGFDWAQADVPVLAAVAARLRTDASARRLTREVAIVAADWAKTPSKRAVYSALPNGSGWRVAREAPPERGWQLAALLDRAQALRDRHDMPVLVGVDASLGLPTLYVRATGEASFVDALQWLDARGGLQAEWEATPREPGSAGDGPGASEPDAWRADRPFFRVPAGRGALTRLVDRAGGNSMLLRQVERMARARPTFVLSGIPGTVGSGTRELWKQLAPMLRASSRSFALWPFDGRLAALTSEPAVVLAEAYPRAAYALALANTLPTAPRPLAKTKASVRAESLAELQCASWLREAKVALCEAGVRSARAGEDDFDALMLCAGLLRCALEQRTLSGELVDPLAEGGILGTGELRLPTR